MREVVTEGEAGMGEACRANIGARGRRRRLVNGIALLAAGGGAAALLIASGQPRAWRWIAFAPFWLGALCIVQAQEKTCVVLAARGRRDMDRGLEVVEDAEERAQLRRQARRVHLRTLLAAAVLTGGALLFPE